MAIVGPLFVIPHAFLVIWPYVLASPRLPRGYFFGVLLSGMAGQAYGATNKGHKVVYSGMAAFFWIQYLAPKDSVRIGVKYKSVSRNYFAGFLNGI